MPSRAPPLVALRSLTIRRTIAVSLHPANITRAQTRHRHKDTLSVDPIQGQNKWAKMWRHGGRDMKLFGGKKGDDKAPMQGDDEAGYYDSPVETVSLSDPRGSSNRAAPSSSSGGGGGGAAAQQGGSSGKVVVDQH